eukprot:TRINITY_DN10338_c0_g1_i1.p1 TRINITY_DN10338_c0_g1~~TRINITY_DN10338_c0_g1_i1.p1  ORF type:complete len:393 (+),score=51.61 TRINITY_DN10338_c0_g1_i1:121-1299(+)
MEDLSKKAKVEYDLALNTNVLHLRQEYLIAAIGYWEQAITITVDPTTKSTIYRNMGAAHTHYALSVQKHDDTDSLMLLKRYQTTISCFTSSLNWGFDRSEDWKDGIREKIKEALDKICSVNCPALDKLDKLLQMEMSLKSHSEICLYLYLKISSVSIDVATAQQKKGEWRASKQNLISLKQYLDAVLSSGVYLKPTLQDYCTELFKKRQNLLLIVDAVISRISADVEFEEALKFEDLPKMEAMWDLLDEYHRSYASLKGSGLEQEAISASRLGRIFNHLLFKDKARKHFDISIRIAAALSLDNLTPDWLRDAQHFMKNDEALKYQDISPEVQALRSRASVTTQKFLEYIYTTHPPKNPEQKNAYDSVDEKKALSTALVHFHPDRQGCVIRNF